METIGDRPLLHLERACARVQRGGWQRSLLLRVARASIGTCLLQAVVACTPETDANAPSGEDGPVVVYEVDSPGLALNPWPDDRFCVVDPSTPTRLRVALPDDIEHPGLAAEWSHLTSLDGFSVFPHIEVSFSAPLDVDTVTPESVRLYDVDPASPEFGRSVPLDLKTEAYPLSLQEPRAFFPFEAGWETAPSLAREATDHESARYIWAPSTRTLLLRPLFPLRNKTKYAVLLTTAVKGVGGAPIRSPFDAPYPPAHEGALTPARTWADADGASLGFGWVFTTQSAPRTLDVIRRALDGDGPLASHIAGGLPALTASALDVERDGNGALAEQGVPADSRDHQFILQAEMMERLLEAVEGPMGEMLPAALHAADYFVLGTLRSPDFRTDGVIAPWPDTLPPVWREVPFLLVVPKETDQHHPPFPVAIYSHGASSSRLESVSMCQELLEKGIAVAAIDAVGHGPAGGSWKELRKRDPAVWTPELTRALAEDVGDLLAGDAFVPRGDSADDGLDALEEIGLWRALFSDGRSEDLDGDGTTLSGDGYFSGEPARLRSAAQQTVVDTLALVRALRSFDPESPAGPGLTTPGTAPATELEAYLKRGDFNADGILDVGGPHVAYTAFGASVGGMHTAIAAAIDPFIEAAVPIAAGGGWVDVVARTSQEDWAQGALGGALGLTLVACPVAPSEGSGALELALTWNAHSRSCRDSHAISAAEAVAHLPRLAARPGATVRLTNLALKGAHESYAVWASTTVQAAEGGGFSVQIATAAGDPLQLDVLGESGEVIESLSITAPRPGLGLQRNTPSFRRWLALAQTQLDAGDPMAYSRALLRERPEGKRATPILHLVATGDWAVPVAASLAWARGVGLLGLADQDAIAITRLFAERGALEPTLPWDADGRQDPSAAIGPLPIIASGQGMSGIRFAAAARHTYITTPSPAAPFDWATFSRGQLAVFLATAGSVLNDSSCLEAAQCSRK